MKILKTLVPLIIFVVFLFGCDLDRNTIDKSYYTSDVCVEEVDSSYFKSEAFVNGKKTVFVNVHCTASQEGKDLSGYWFLDFFKYELGWGKPGYNEIVELDGNRFIAVPYDLDGITTWDEVSYGVRGINSISINIAYVGGVDKHLRPKDTRTPEQIRAIDEIIHEIRCAIPNIIVIGHRDHPNVYKACPSFDVYEEYGGDNPYINNTEEFDYFTDEDF